jgi:Tfp pilus assembly protein PilN
MRPVNLLPESQRRRDPGARAGSSYVVVGVLSALLVMTLAYVLVSNQVTSRNDEAAAASAEAERLEARVGALGAFGDFTQVLQTRATSVRELASSRFDWERLMRELARVLPDEGWLQEAEASLTGEEAAGSTGLPVAAGGPQINLIGCTPKQSDVASLMVRLRRVHRVEDVTLNESKREKAGSPASLETCGRLYQFDLDVTFAAAVASEAPAGRTSVPASLGGGS